MIQNRRRSARDFRFVRPPFHRFAPSSNQTLSDQEVITVYKAKIDKGIKYHDLIDFLDASSTASLERR
jgi:hypothetical protein